jgi:hypothetical protein
MFFLLLFLLHVALAPPSAVMGVLARSQIQAVSIGSLVPGLVVTIVLIVGCVYLLLAVRALRSQV